MATQVPDLFGQFRTEQGAEADLQSLRILEAKGVSLLPPCRPTLLRPPHPALLPTAPCRAR